MLKIASRWALPALLTLPLLLLAGCASAPGSKCFAKALPTSGEGSLAWDNDLTTARVKSVADCRRYAARSGGSPETCKVIVAKCE
jgi:hypothetical protein